MNQPRFEISSLQPMPKVCVVYDQATGAIVHMHQIIAMPGAPEATDDELIAEALELSGRGDAKVRGRIATLVVGRDVLDRQVAYKVDPRRKVLVPLGRVDGATPRPTAR